MAIIASHTVYLVRTFINMAKAELYTNTQEYMGWKELQKNYMVQVLKPRGRQASNSREETFRLGQTDGLVLYKGNCSR